MDRPVVNKRWFRERLTQVDLSQAALARAIKMHPSAMSLLLDGKRKCTVAEAHRIARYLKSDLNAVLTAFGLPSPDRPDRIRIMGYVGAGDAVVLLDSHDAGYGLEEVESPFPGYTGVVVKVRGDSMAPRYQANELIAYTPFYDDIGRLIGKEVIAQLADGQLMLKVLQRGSTPDTYTLVSLNAKSPPIVNVAIEWASPIDWHRP